MSNTPSAAAATARQRLAGVLGTLQQDPNIPPSIVEIASGLAGAIGPLFKLERGDPDLNLFIQARGVLQGTLEKMQAVDQGFPGVAEATQAIADSLRTIFNALKDAGMIGQPAAQPAPAQPAAQPAPAQPAPAQPPVAFAPTQPQPVTPQPVAQPVAQPAAPPQPIAAQPIAAQPAPVQPAPVQPAPVQPFAAPPAAPAPFANPGAQPPRPASQHAMPVPAVNPGAKPGGPHRTASAAFKAPAPAATVPVGPNGLPRLEAEVNVHSETNFFTDFFGDIRNNGGVFVATFHVLPLEAQCEVALAFPGDLSAEVRGYVKFTRPASDGASPGLGIAITSASPDAWNLIERFVKKREPIMHDV